MAKFEIIIMDELQELL